MKLVWAEGAVADLAHIRDYIAKHNPRAAGDVAKQLLQAAELLPRFPQSGVATARSGIRRLIVPNTVYSLIYRIADRDIEIIEVFDGRRRKPRTEAIT